MNNEEWFYERYKAVKSATAQWPEWAQESNRKEYESHREETKRAALTNEQKAKEKQEVKA